MKKNELKTKAVYDLVYKADKRLGSKMSVTFMVESIMGHPKSLLITECNYCDATNVLYGRRIDTCISVKGDDLRKLAGKFQAMDDKALVRRLKERFAPYQNEIKTKFVEFCEKKNINYNISVS